MFPTVNFKDNVLESIGTLGQFDFKYRSIYFHSYVSTRSQTKINAYVTKYGSWFIMILNHVTCIYVKMFLLIVYSIYIFDANKCKF